MKMKMMFAITIFWFKYASNIIFGIMYFKTKNNNICSVDIIEKDKNNQYVFGSIILINNLY